MNSREEEREHQSKCPFCNIEKWRIQDESNEAFLIVDKYPVVGGHRLIVSNRHVSSYFDLSVWERDSISHLVAKTGKLLKKEDPTILGFNVGINIGETAGQTVDHCHVHLIPRREGDVENPIGGVRNVIPGKGDYLNETKYEHVEVSYTFGDK